MAKLYEISEQLKNLEALTENEDLPQEIIKQALEGVQGDLNEKIINMCKYIKNLESDADGIKSEVERLTAMKKIKVNTITSIKEYMFNTLKDLNMKSVKTPLFSVGIQNNPASVNVTDADRIPLIYAVPQELKFDKKQLLADLKEGKVIDGCEIQQTERIQIR